MKESPEIVTGTTQNPGETLEISDETFYLAQGAILAEMLGTENEVLEKWLAVPGNAQLSRVLTYEYLVRNRGQALREDQVVVAAEDLLVRLGGSVNLQ